MKRWDRVARWVTLLLVALAVAAAPGCTTSEPISFGGKGPIDRGNGSGGTAVITDPAPPIIETGLAPQPQCGVPANGPAAAARKDPFIQFMQPVLSPTVTATVPPPPLSGGTLVVLSDGRALASDPDRDRLYLVDLAGGKVAKEVVLQPRDEPGRIVEGAGATAYVVLRGGGAVLAVDTSSGAIKSRRAVCGAPRGIAFDAVGTSVAGRKGAVLHVACAGGELVSLPATGDVALRTVMLERDLRDVIVSGNGLMVSRFRQAEVLLVGGDGVVTQRLLPASRQRKGARGLEEMAASVAWRMLPMPGMPGAAVVVHQRAMAGEVVVGPGGYSGGFGCMSIVESAVTVLSASAGTMNGPALALSALPIDLAIAPSGAVAVLSAGNAHAPGLSQVGVFDAVSDISRPGPECVSPPGSGGPVPPIGVVGKNSLQPRAPGETIAVAYAPDGTLVGQSREPALLWLMKPDSPAEASAPRTIALTADSRADTGHLVFHANAGGGLACASCHPEGGEDGRVWKFACVGDRRTQSLRGGISGTEPFHWDGDMTTFPHLVDNVFVGRMSGPMLLADQSGALLKWIDTIPGMPARAQPSDAVARGKALFNSSSVACATCHLGARLTNNTTVDVGTGKALQVPSLLGLGWRAPLMHNGCASGVADRFGACGGGDKHGRTSDLSAAQITDLVAYLESI